MDEIKPDIRTDLAGVGIVLNESVEKSIGIECVNDSRPNQIRRERSLLRQLYRLRL
jgi:hypothetical protein